MAARSLGLAATFALSASAFLLPPDVSADSIAGDVGLDLWTLVEPGHTLIVPCTGCGSDQNGPKSLFLNISEGSQPGTLELGGRPFYPPPSFALPNAALVSSSKSMAAVLSEPKELENVAVSAMMTDVHRHKEMVTEEGDQLITLTLTIFTVDEMDISVPKIKVEAFESATGELTMQDAKAEKKDLPEERPETLPEVGHEDEPKCDSALCGWRQFFQDKMHGISSAAHKQFGSGRPCPGKMRGMMKDGKMPHGPFTNMHHGPGSHHRHPIGDTGRPLHHNGHFNGHHHHHHGLHRFMRGVGQFIKAVAIPIAIGIAAGALSYAVGMVVGMVIALIWIKVFRRGKQGYASVAQTEDDDTAKEVIVYAEERESFESAPPVYEDAPAYEEKEVA